MRILVDNALRYSPERRGRSRRARLPRRDARRSASPTAGPGVDDHDRDLIFERFDRGSAQSGEGGFGLGLAIGRELAERMGGTPRARAGPNRAPGRRSVLALPIELPGGSHPSDEPAETPAAEPQAT